MPTPNAVAVAARSWPISPSTGGSSTVERNGSVAGSQTARSSEGVSRRVMTGGLPLPGPDRLDQGPVLSGRRGVGERVAGQEGDGAATIGDDVEREERVARRGRDAAAALEKDRRPRG